MKPKRMTLEAYYTEGRKRFGPDMSKWKLDPDQFLMVDTGNGIIRHCWFMPANPLRAQAQALGVLARGVPRRLSEDQKEAKRRTLAASRLKRWPEKGA